jgi:Replication-relaxation
MGTARSTREHPFVITPVYDILLRGSDSVPVGIYHLQMATAEQLCRLHYAKGSLKAIKARLKTLADAGFIQFDAIPTKFAKSPYYYALAKKSLDYLTEAGLDDREYFRPSREVNKYALFIEHTLELNDVLIAASLIHKIAPAITCRFIHERTLKRSPYRATWTVQKQDVYHDEVFTLIPDALLEFQYRPPNSTIRRNVFLVEHDRGSEQKNYFRKRIRAYIVFLKTRAYTDLFHIPRATILFTTFIGERRLEEMREWTRQELASTREPPPIAQQILFASLRKPPDPHSFFLDPCWVRPFDVERENQKTIPPVSLRRLCGYIAQ